MVFMVNESLLKILLISLLTSGYSYILFVNSIPILKKLAIAVPNKRSLHKTSTPTGSGIIFAIAGSLATILTNNFLPLISLPLSIVGFIDDISSLPIKRRLLLQTLTSLLLLQFSGLPSIFLSSFNIFLSIIIFAFLIFCGVAIINFINFADGIDGLVGGCFIVYLTTYSWLYDNSLWPFVGLLSVFIYFNWSPARLFMGDAGSTYLGAIMVSTFFKSGDIESAFSLLLIGLPLLGDTCLCVLRRIKAKQKIFEPHRLHLFQRLILSGMSHHKVSIIYISSTFLIAISFVLGGFKAEIISTALILSLAIILEKRYAKPFKG